MSKKPSCGTTGLIFLLIPIIAGATILLLQGLGTGGLSFTDLTDLTNALWLTFSLIMILLGVAFWLLFRRKECKKK